MIRKSTINLKFANIGKLKKLKEVAESKMLIELTKVEKNFD